MARCTLVLQGVQYKSGECRCWRSSAGVRDVQESPSQQPQWMENGGNSSLGWL